MKQATPHETSAPSWLDVPGELAARSAALLSAWYHRRRHLRVSRVSANWLRELNARSAGRRYR